MDDRYDQYDDPRDRSGGDSGHSGTDDPYGRDEPRGGVHTYGGVETYGSVETYGGVETYGDRDGDGDRYGDRDGDGRYGGVETYGGGDGDGRYGGADDYGRDDPYDRYDGDRPHPRTRRRRALGWVSAGLSLLLVGGGVAGFGFYRKIENNINKRDVSDNINVADRPKKLDKSMNILVLGSDSRAGQNRQYGTTGGQRSDTTMLLHISPGGGEAVGISFPRDSMVQVPSCKRSDGTRSTARLDLLNTAYSDAGAGCTWKMLEGLTGIRIDHFVEIDFAGFTRVVDALGGVEICVPKAVNDPKARLKLPAGKQTVRGQQALGYVRTRTGGLGDGSDLSRIDRQKKFMASIVQKATSGGLLTNPAKLYKFLDAATKSISTDKGFSAGAMKQTAEGMKGMSAGKVRFVTVPVEAYPPDPNRVQWIQGQSETLFEAIRQDNKPPAAPKKDLAAAAGNGQPAAQQTVDPSRVLVNVRNATGISGLGGRAASALEDAGFKINGTPGNAPVSGTAKTQILYGAGAARLAATLAARVPGAQPRQSANVRPGLVTLVVGQDWKGLAGQAPSIPKTTGEVRGNGNICDGK